MEYTARVSLPLLTDVLQLDDHLVSEWPPGETPVESAS
jgi:hypothetical protein